MRFYLIDRIIVLSIGQSIEGIKCVTKSEDFLEQHFPGYPVMPGVLIIESMAQLSGYLLSKTKEAKGQYIFAILSMVEKAKFYKMVSPGEQMKIISKIENENDESAIVKTQAFVEGERVAEAKMMFIFFPIEGETESAKRNIMSGMFAGIENKINPFKRKSEYV